MNINKTQKRITTTSVPSCVESRPVSYQKALSANKVRVCVELVVDGRNLIYSATLIDFVMVQCFCCTNCFVSYYHHPKHQDRGELICVLWVVDTCVFIVHIAIYLCFDRIIFCVCASLIDMQTVCHYANLVWFRWVVNNMRICNRR